MARWSVAALTAWVGLLVLVLVLAETTGLDPAPDHYVRTVVYAASYLTLLLSILAAARRHPHRAPALTTWLVLSWALYVGGDIVTSYVAQPGDGPRRLTDASDLMVLGAYAVIIGALVRSSARARQQLDLDQTLDICIVGVALGTVAWVGFVAPGLRAPVFAQSPVSAVVAAAFPALDLLLVAMVVTFLTAPNRSVWSSAVGVICPVLLFLGDCIEFVNLVQHRRLPLAAHVCWILAYGAASVSVTLAPQPYRVRREAPGHPARRGWVPLVYVLGLMPLGIYTWELVTRRPGQGIPDGTALSIAMLLISALVVGRAAGMMATADRQSGDLEILARSDHLTGLPNRRTSDAALARALARVTRSGEPLSVTILDLDHFKAFNDTFGHHAGDELLSGCAHKWSELLGPAETLSRYGGEEFVLITVGLPTSAVIDLVDRLRDATPRGQSFSAGIAVWQRGEGPSDVVARADEALYAAKANGRARTYLWETDDTDLTVPQQGDAAAWPGAGVREGQDV